MGNQNPAPARKGRRPKDELPPAWKLRYIARAREVRRRLTIKAIAARLGMSETHVAYYSVRFWNGKKRLPS